MPARDIDDYLAGVDEPMRGTLQELRRRILIAAPGAEECISYGMPAFRVRGKVVAGFAAFTKHLSYLPHSGSVFRAMTPELAGYTHTTGSLHFALDDPLPQDLVNKLVAVRLGELDATG